MRMKRWARAASLYSDPRVLSILFLGFSSGLPFLLTLSTLHAWLKELGMNKTIIGSFATVTLPYTLKFLWAPMIDRFSVPFLSAIFGRRRGWMLLSQVCLILALIGLGSSDPAHHIYSTAFWAFLVAFCSATQDIVIEAYRTEILSQTEAGPGAGASVLGYRLGMWVAGAGALYLATYFNWLTVYGVMAAAVCIGMITVLLSPEPAVSIAYPFHLTQAWKEGKLIPFGKKIQESSLLPGLILPLKTFFQRQEWRIILAFIFLYKVGDTVLNTMSIPFLLEIGFSKIEIAHVAKSFGIGAMILGGLLGGLLLARHPLIQTMIVCAFLQILASLMFMIQAMLGKNLFFLFATMGIENLACGMGAATLITYLSTLCLLPHTATHFALLSSFGSLARIVLSFCAGWAADHLPWVSFYGLTALGCLPCLLLLFFFAPHFSYNYQDQDQASRVA